MSVQISLPGYDFSSSGYILRGRIAGSCGSKISYLLVPKGDQSWVFTGRTDDEAEIPIFWPPDVKS